MAATVKLDMSIKQYKQFADFLDGHEYEIATEQDAYGELRDMFVLVFDVEPSENS